MKKIFKQKLVLLFLLIVGIAVVVNSCQQDDFLSEQEKFSKYVKQEKFAFNYLSQDIQDKLDAVSLGFNSKNNDSITAGLQLVTDSAVVFTHIPTGKKYYTFVVKRLPSNGKLENLVLVENGASFDEYLVQYNNSTPSNQDKATMHKLQNGVYSNLANKRQDCQEVTVWVPCGTNEHNESNFFLWHECVASQKPYIYTYLNCREVSDGYQSHNNGNGFSNGSGGGGDGIGISPFPIETEPPLVVTGPLMDEAQDDKVVIDESLEGTEIDCILTKMLLIDSTQIDPTNGHIQLDFFNKMLVKFNEVEAPSLEFIYEPNQMNLGDSVSYALTEKTNGVLKIRSSTFLENSSKLDIEITLVHELMHAYMWASMEEWGYLEFDEDGNPIVLWNNLDCSNLNSFYTQNYNGIPFIKTPTKFQFRVALCGYKSAYSQLNNAFIGVSDFYISWSHYLFNNNTYFDEMLYFDKLYDYIENHHDWNSEPNDWKQAMQNQFGEDWKKDVSKIMCYEGLVDDEAFYKNLLIFYLNYSDNDNFSYRDEYFRLLNIIKNTNNEYEYQRLRKGC